jgi:hypothetical protein
MSRPIPRSLHTITALAQVALLILEHQPMPAGRAVKAAAIALGYSHLDDPHGLCERAIKTVLDEFLSDPRDA